MSQSTISTFQLFEMFPDEETARKYLEDYDLTWKIDGKRARGTRGGQPPS